MATFTAASGAHLLAYLSSFLKKFRLTKVHEKDRDILTLANLENGYVRRFIVEKVEEEELINRKSSLCNGGPKSPLKTNGFIHLPHIPPFKPRNGDCFQMNSLEPLTETAEPMALSSLEPTNPPLKSPPSPTKSTKSIGEWDFGSAKKNDEVDEMTKIPNGDIRHNEEEILPKYGKTVMQENNKNHNNNNTKIIPNGNAVAPISPILKRKKRSKLKNSDRSNVNSNQLLTDSSSSEPNETDNEDLVDHKRNQSNINSSNKEAVNSSKGDAKSDALEDKANLVNKFSNGSIPNSKNKSVLTGDDLETGNVNLHAEDPGVFNPAFTNDEEGENKTDDKNDGHNQLTESNTSIAVERSPLMAPRLLQTRSLRNSPASNRSGYQSGRSSISSQRKGILKKSGSCVTINFANGEMNRSAPPSEKGDLDDLGDGDLQPQENQRSINRVKFILDSGKADNVHGSYEDIKVQIGGARGNQSPNDDEDTGKRHPRPPRKRIIVIGAIVSIAIISLISAFVVSEKSTEKPARFGNRAPPVILPDVMNAIEIKFRITNSSLPTDNSLDNVTLQLEKDLKSILVAEEIGYGNTKMDLRITNIEPTDNRLTSRIGWTFFDPDSKPPPPVDNSLVEQRLKIHLLKSNGFIGDYLIESPEVHGVEDICANNNLKCSHNCTFNYEQLIFKCDCPTPLVLYQDKVTCGKNDISNPYLFDEFRKKLQVIGGQFIGIKHEDNKKEGQDGKEGDKSEEEASPGDSSSTTSSPSISPHSEVSTTTVESVNASSPSSNDTVGDVEGVTLPSNITTEPSMTTTTTTTTVATTTVQDTTTTEKVDSNTNQTATDTVTPQSDNVSSVEMEKERNETVVVESTTSSPSTMPTITSTDALSTTMSTTTTMKPVEITTPNGTSIDTDSNTPVVIPVENVSNINDDSVTVSSIDDVSLSSSSTSTTVPLTTTVPNPSISTSSTSSEEVPTTKPTLILTDEENVTVKNKTTPETMNTTISVTTESTTKDPSVIIDTSTTTTIKSTVEDIEVPPKIDISSSTTTEISVSSTSSPATTSISTSVPDTTTTSSSQATSIPTSTITSAPATTTSTPANVVSSTTTAPSSSEPISSTTTTSTSFSSAPIISTTTSTPTSTAPILSTTTTSTSPAPIPSTTTTSTSPAPIFSFSTTTSSTSPAPSTTSQSTSPSISSSSMPPATVIQDFSDATASSVGTTTSSSTTTTASTSTTPSEISIIKSEEISLEDSNPANKVPPVVRVSSSTSTTLAPAVQTSENPAQILIVPSNIPEPKLPKIDEKLPSSPIQNISEVTASVVPPSSLPTPTTPSPMNVTTASSPPLDNDCSVGEHFCDGRCLPSIKRCDSVRDCSDDSDEMDCVVNKCFDNFQCWSGRCVPRPNVCDGVTDCVGGDDEIACNTWQCLDNEFRCPNTFQSSEDSIIAPSLGQGPCLARSLQCDGQPDCFNHTDERNCVEEGISCSSNEFQCPEGWCIPNGWKCDGVPDCEHGEDEQQCTCQSLDEVQCNIGGCVPKFQLCDGLRQCPDGSDEWGCIRLQNETRRLEVRSGESWRLVCGDGWTVGWSDFVCEHLVGDKSASTEVRRYDEKNSESSLWNRAKVKLVPNASSRSRSPVQYALRDECTSETLVHLQCIEDTCGEWSDLETGSNIGNSTTIAPSGKEVTLPSHWPSLAFLFHHSSSDDGVTTHSTSSNHPCTASVLSPFWLITSHTCLASQSNGLDPDSWAAVSGEGAPDVSSSLNQQRKLVRQIIKYPGVKRQQGYWTGDVALVRLESSLSINDYTRPICLPHLEEKEEEIDENRPCLVKSWNPTNGASSSVAHQTFADVMNLTVCNATHYHNRLSSSHICADLHQEFPGPCHGIEGSPLMCLSSEGTWEIEGLLSHYNNCGTANHPAIFTSLRSVRTWALNTIGKTRTRKRMNIMPQTTVPPVQTDSVTIKSTEVDLKTNSNGAT